MRNQQPDYQNVELQVYSMLSRKNFTENRIVEQNQESRRENYGKLPYHKTSEQKIVENPTLTIWENIQRTKKREQLRNIPVYTIVNEFNEIPKVQTYNVNKTVARFYNYNNVSTNKRNQIIKNLFNDQELKKFSLVFLNKDDAELYKQTIGVQKSNAVKKYGISVYTTNMERLGKIIRHKNKQDQYFIVPDLLELEKLLTKYQYKTTFHHRQYHEHDKFQGIPIYMFKNSINIDNENLTPVFFKLEDAMLTWTNYRTKQEKRNLSKHPELIVYNFESFINEKYLQKPEKYQIFPSHESYKQSKKDMTSRGEKINIRQRIINTIVPKFKFLYNIL